MRVDKSGYSIVRKHLRCIKGKIKRVNLMQDIFCDYCFNLRPTFSDVR